MWIRAALASFVMLLLGACNGDAGPSMTVDADTETTILDGTDDVCTPICENRECGGDGCGGNCGACQGMLERCSDAGQCEPFPCKSTKDCPGSLICNQDNGTCVLCVGDEDCLSGEICGSDFACHEQIPCASDKDCKTDGLVCDKDAGFCVECLSSVDCDDVEYCFESFCLNDICLGGESSCNGQDVLFCNEDGSFEEVTVTCTETQYCEDGDCYDQVCPPGEVYCDGSDLNTCDDSGKGILTTIDCEANGLFCHEGECIDQVCEPGSTWCSDNFTAAACGEDGMSSTLAPCPADFYCEDGTCHHGVCVPGSVFCDGDVYKVCNGKGSGLQYQEDCGENDQFCFDGACIDSICPPGMDYCSDGSTKAHCSNDGSDFSTESCPAQHYCDAGDDGVQCLPWVCTPGSSSCEDNVAQVCNAIGSAVTNELDCGVAVCIDGTCKPVICEANATSCEDNVVMLCDPTGTELQDLQTCTEDEYCEEQEGTAACASQVCEPGQEYCNGMMVMLCNPFGSGGSFVEDCSDANKYCSAGLCTDCEPSCDGKECGDDGCGGSCGDCDDGNTCSIDMCSGGACLYFWAEPCCGNGDVEGEEQCDDGNQVDDGACNADCTRPPLAFLGYWSHFYNCSVETHEEMDVLSDQGCQAQFGASAFSASHLELKLGIIQGLPPTAPGSSSSRYIFKCPHCEGPPSDWCLSGSIRNVAMGASPWPTEFDEGWGQLANATAKAICVEEIPVN